MSRRSTTWRPWSQGNDQALAPSTAKRALIALNQILRFAVRRGWTGVNPMMQLEPGEKPRWRVEHVRVLEGGDLGRLLAHTDAASRPLFEFLAYTGLRSGRPWGCAGVMWTSRLPCSTSGSSFPGSARRNT